MSHLTCVSLVEDVLKTGVAFEKELSNASKFNAFDDKLKELQKCYETSKDGTSICICLMYNLIISGIISGNANDAFLYYNVYDDFETAKEVSLKLSAIVNDGKIRNVSALYVKSNGMWKEMVYYLC